VKRLERIAALLALPLAAALIVLATNTLLVTGEVSDDDVRFQSSATRQRELWHSAGVLPELAGERALGIEDDLAYRRVVFLFAQARPGVTSPTDPRIQALRGRAQLELTRTSQAESDPRRRSQLLNFLGVLPLDRGIQDPRERASVLRTAIGVFQSAVRVDPENADAKVNLELVLRDSATAAVPANQPSGERSGGRRSGAGTGGGGY
jgi:hypothetical protein